MSRYRFFGGKGGVGKTTAASATALFLLNKLKPDNSILLFSTDPAHSLSDSLGVKVGNRLVKVAEHKGAKLIAYEMDAALALERFREAHVKVLAEIAERGTLLDEEDINELLNLSLPGLDEVMSLFELSELDRKGAYAHIVVDTAPSGHTSRLLRLPEVFTRMVHALDRMGEKHRYMVQHFARRRVVADEVDLFLRDLTARIQSVRNLLYDPRQTDFTLVTIPEAMSVRETERYLSLLREQGVPVTDLIVNRVEQEHDACVYCKARVKTQRPWLKEIEKLFGDLRLHYVPLMVEEVRGVEALRKLGKLVWNSDAKRQ
ncbi:MAG TPA: ArsA family ATPase [Pyrinomonadaceae bacterium]|nr:ArsA family ATPase [Pyrinomonadaceae bacterium]